MRWKDMSWHKFAIYIKIQNRTIITVYTIACFDLMVRKRKKRNKERNDDALRWTNWAGMTEFYPIPLISYDNEHVLL